MLEVKTREFLHLGALSYADLMHQNHHLEVVKLVSASSSKKRLKHMQSRSLQQLNGGVCYQAHIGIKFKKNVQDV